MAKFEIGKHYKVTWVDAASLREGWYSIEEAIWACAENFKKRVTSVGVLVHEAEEYIIMAGSSDGDLLGEVTLVPKCNIKKSRLFK